MELSEQRYHPSPLMRRAQRLWPDWWNTSVGNEVAEIEAGSAALVEEIAQSLQARCRYVGEHVWSDATGSWRHIDSPCPSWDDAELVRSFASPVPTEDRPTDDDESCCHRCGRANVSWSAPSPLWNEVMRGGDINGPWKYNEIICPSCFADLAEKCGVAHSWRLSAEVVQVELQTVTPSGRIWDESTWLWRVPAPTEEPAWEPDTAEQQQERSDMSRALHAWAAEEPTTSELCLAESRLHLARMCIKHAGHDGEHCDVAGRGWSVDARVASPTPDEAPK